MQPTVLVTGANGYTGYWFCKYLAEKGIKTRGMYYPPDGVPDLSYDNLELVPGDVLDRESIKQAVDGIEVVQNIAALYRPMNVSEEMYQAVNVDGVRTMLEESAAAGVKRFVQCSTMGVHGTVDSPPGNEESPIRPDDYYQRTKYEGEELTRRLATGTQFALQHHPTGGHIRSTREKVFEARQVCEHRQVHHVRFG